MVWWSVGAETGPGPRQPLLFHPECEGSFDRTVCTGFISVHNPFCFEAACRQYAGWLFCLTSIVCDLLLAHVLYKPYILRGLPTRVLE
jgi:hypothetical protein